MTEYLPWVAIALAAAALLARDGSPTAAERPVMPGLKGQSKLLVGFAVLVLIALLAGWAYREHHNSVLPSAIGFALGGVVAVLAHVAESAKGKSLVGAAAPISLGVLAVGLASLAASPDRTMVGLGAACGAGLCAWLLSLVSSDSGNWAVLTALFASAASACDTLGAIGHGDKAADAGLALGSIAVLAGLAGAGAARLIESQQGERVSRAGLTVVLSLLFLLLGASVIGQKFLYMADAWRIFGGGVLTAVVVHWFLPDNVKPSALRFMIAAVAWIGLATVAFGLRKGFGMSIALLGGSATLVLLGNRRALMTLGPFLALVLVRVFREVYPAEFRALDIGQHYAMIGLLLGAALPLMPVEWRRVLPPVATEAKSATAGSLWCLLLLGAIPAAAILLGAKGTIGFLVGLGLSALLEGVRGGVALHTVGIIAALSSFVSISYGWLGEHLDKTRDEKIGFLYAVVAILLVLALIVAALTPRKVESLDESAV